MDASIGQLSLAAGMSGVPHALVGVAAVGTVLCLEVPWRVAGIRVADIGVKKCAQSCATVLGRCAPEVLGFSVVLFLALLLRLRGDTENMPTPQEQQAWEQIKREWPILMGADTLLNLQAMLRLLVLLFVAIRAEAGGRSPFSGMAALLSLGGALTRGMLSTQTRMYRLEGPLSLGGDLAVACELASVPFLAALGLKEFQRTPLKASLLVGGAMWFGSHHYLNLAKDATTDQLFIQAHVLELFASFAYVARAVMLVLDKADREGKDDAEADFGGRRLVEKPDLRGNAFVGFMHMLMTLQQVFSAYYFLTAFQPHPSLVGAGRPFCVLCGGNLLQLGAYLCAAALFVGGCVDVNFQPAGGHLELDRAMELDEDTMDEDPSLALDTELEEGFEDEFELPPACTSDDEFEYEDHYLGIDTD